jgi:hypothetical protein
VTRGRWKEIERWWALQLGGRRVPVTGRQRGDAPDVEHPRYSIEVKAGKVLSDRLGLGIRQAVAASVGTQKTPLLCISHHTAGKRDLEHYVLLRLADWMDLMGDGPEDIE